MVIDTLVSPVIHDRDALEEFADVLADRAPQIEGDIARLRKAPNDRDLIADLFRAFHNVKGDAALCKLDLAVAIAHPIESLLSRLRDGSLVFNDFLAESILLAVDRLELATAGLLQHRPLDNLGLPALIGGLDAMAQAPALQQDDLSRRLIEAVTGFPPVITPLSSKNTGSGALTADLQFFRSLAMQFESRSPLFKGRTMRILRLALETNKMAGSPVDATQLEAAVYVHDIGMMFLPEPIWLKVGRMTQEDKVALRNHPGYAAGLLQRMSGWGAASEMVAQHHEMPDGGGYPNQLHTDRICAGAKVLAIVDAFEAVMLKHIHRGKNRSVLRAIAEINACDNQFAPEWIAPFNAVIRKTIEALMIDADLDRRFSGVGRLYGEAASARLRNAHVCVVGLGGVGSWAAEALARTAIGRLTLIDLDMVAESNTNRQIQALGNNYGKAKIEVMAERILAINPCCEVSTVEEFVNEDNVAELLAGSYAGVIDAIDQVRAKAAMIAYCRRRGVTIVTAGAAGGQIDPTRIVRDDLCRTVQDPLLAKVRSRLRRDYGFTRESGKRFGVTAIYSTEPLRYPSEGHCGTDSGPTGLNCAGFGSAVAVTACFGFAAAACIIERIATP